MLDEAGLTPGLGFDLFLGLGLEVVLGLRGQHSEFSAMKHVRALPLSETRGADREVLT